MTLDEAIAKAKADGDTELAEWLRQARGADASARWFTRKIKELSENIVNLNAENARLRSCLSDDADNARQILGENAKMRELIRDMYAVMVEDAANCDVTYPEQFDDRMRELGIEVDG